jgi:hypothetical protein
VLGWNTLGTDGLQWRLSVWDYKPSLGGSSVHTLGPVVHIGDVLSSSITKGSGGAWTIAMSGPSGSVSLPITSSNLFDNVVAGAMENWFVSSCDQLPAQRTTTFPTVNVYYKNSSGTLVLTPESWTAAYQGQATACVNNVGYSTTGSSSTISWNSNWSRNLPGYGGKSYGGNDSCFFDNHGSTNLSTSCGAQDWFTGLQADDSTVAGASNSGSWYFPRARVTSTTSTLSCQAWGVSQDLLSTSISPWRSSTVGRTGELIGNDGVWVPHYGHLFSFCHLQSGASLNDLEW